MQRELNPAGLLWLHLELIEIGEARYNTQAGGHRGPSDDELIGRFRLYIPITATVSHVYKRDGFDANSLVFPFNHYIDPNEGVLVDPEIGDTGLAFISTNLGDVEGNPASEMARSPWVSHMRGISLEMNANGWDSDIRRVLEWSEYSGGQATEHRSGITLPIGDLESHVAALVAALP